MNFKTLWEGKRTRIALIAGAGLLVAGAAFVIVGAVDDTPGWVPAPFAGGSQTASTDGDSLDGTSGTKESATSAKPVSNNNANTGTDATDAGTDTSTGADAPGTSPGTPGTEAPSDEPAAKQMTARILYWNDTENRPASVVVSIGEAKWSPADSEARSAEGKLGELPFDKALKIVVMSDGPAGKRIEVPVRFTADMIADSTGDAIHVEVKDGTVRVLGTPVDNFDVTFDRF
ncbi:MAG: hypothetical protein ACYC6C_08255 [Coriobacteriia bacterium]